MVHTVLPIFMCNQVAVFCVISFTQCDLHRNFLSLTILTIIIYSAVSLYVLGRLLKHRLAHERSADVTGNMRNNAGINLRKRKMTFPRNWLPATGRGLTFSGISVSNFKVTRCVTFTEMKLVVCGHVSAGRSAVHLSMGLEMCHY
jgi:hypothetical protein